MNYYERHIGDYLKDTAHLSLLEHGIYGRLLDVYYTRESAIPDEQVARLIGARSKEEMAAMRRVLSEFFGRTEEGDWIQLRCEREISRYQDKQRKASASANARWKKGAAHTERNANAMRTHSEGNAPNHQTPDTNPPLPPEGGAHDSKPEEIRPEVAVAIALRKAGIDANAHHPRLLSLVNAGAKVEEFLAFAEKARLVDNAFPYLLGCVEGERKRAAATAGQLHQGAMPAQSVTVPGETTEAYIARMAAERAAERERLAKTKPDPEVMARLAALAGGMRV